MLRGKFVFTLIFSVGGQRLSAESLITPIYCCIHSNPSVNKSLLSNYWFSVSLSVATDYLLLLSVITAIWELYNRSEGG